MIEFPKFYNYVCWILMVFVAGWFIIYDSLPEDALQLGAVCGLICGLEQVRRLAERVFPGEEVKNEGVKE